MLESGTKLTMRASAITTTRKCVRVVTAVPRRKVFKKKNLEVILTCTIDLYLHGADLEVGDPLNLRFQSGTVAL